MDTDEQERMLRERGFGLRMGFGVRPALLVIDMIKAFTDPDQPLGSNLDAQIDATGSLIEAAHARQLSVTAPAPVAVTRSLTAMTCASVASGWKMTSMGERSQIGRRKAVAHSVVRRNAASATIVCKEST